MITFLISFSLVLLIRSVATVLGLTPLSLIDLIISSFTLAFCVSLTSGVRTFATASNWEGYTFGLCGISCCVSCSVCVSATYLAPSASKLIFCWPIPASLYISCFFLPSDSVTYVLHVTP